MPKTSALVKKTTLVAADEILIVDSEVTDPTATEATKYVEKTTLSAQVQADLIANSTNYNALGILMKGYKEYTFAIRQSGTDAPTIYVIKDDFELETALTFTYASIGIYTCDIDSLGVTIDERLGIDIQPCVSANNNSTGYALIQGRFYETSAIFLEVQTVNLNADGTQEVKDAIIRGGVGATISIRETLEDT